MSDEYEPHHWLDRLLFSIWRNLYPIDERAMNRRYRGVDLYSRYVGWFHLACAIGCLVRTAVLFVLLVLGLWWTKSEPPVASSDLVVIRDLHPLWLLPLFTASLVIGAWFADGIYRVVLWNRYSEFADFCNWKCGFDGTKALRSMMVVLVPISTVFALVLMNHYWVVGRGAIRIHSLWSVREYAYSDVRCIVQDDVHRNIISGETGVNPRATSIIHFRDGRQVSLLATLPKEPRERWSKWLSESARIPIIHVARHADFKPLENEHIVAVVGL